MIQYLSSVYSPFRGVRLYILYTKQLTFMFTLKTTACIYINVLLLFGMLQMSLRYFADCLFRVMRLN